MSPRWIFECKQTLGTWKQIMCSPLIACLLSDTFTREFAMQISRTPFAGVMQGWKLAWDEFLNKSQTSHVHRRKHNPHKMLQEMFFSLRSANACRAQTNCGSKRIRIIDTKWWHSLSRQLICVRKNDKQTQEISTKICFYLRGELMKEKHKKYLSLMGHFADESIYQGEFD